MADVGEVIALKTCPFCGARAQVLGDKKLGYMVRCQGMNCFGPGTSRYGELDDVIVAWNRRAPDPERDELREALSVAQTAMNDWLHTYAPEFCDQKYVAETNARIAEYGTIAYIAHVSEVISAARLVAGKGVKG